MDIILSGLEVVCLCRCQRAKIRPHILLCKTRLSPHSRRDETCADFEKASVYDGDGGEVLAQMNGAARRRPPTPSKEDAVTHAEAEKHVVIAMNASAACHTSSFSSPLAI